MKKKIYSLIFLVLVSYGSFSQSVGIGTTTPDPSSALDIRSINKGLLIPRMNMTSINAIVNPAKGLMVYDSVASQLMINAGTPATPNWQAIGGNLQMLAPSASNTWALNGNSGIDPVNQFLGTTDNQPLRIRINNINAGDLHPVLGNVFWGLRAGQATTLGFSNIAIGTDALKLNTNISGLVAIGDSALFNNKRSAPSSNEGAFNTAVGSKSLFSNLSGASNTAIGNKSLFSNTTGGNNTTVGSLSLLSNTSGSENTACGTGSLVFNTTGTMNTSAGYHSLFSNTTGLDNTAVGVGALLRNTMGDLNTAVGMNALSFNSGNLGQFNTAVGGWALFATIQSQFNTAIGYRAGASHNLGYNNTLIGAKADVFFADIFNSVALGESSLCTANSQVRFGNTFTASIGGFVGYSNLSDGRFKKNIQESVKGIDFIMKLRPVMYQWDLNSLNQELYPARKMDEFANKNTRENETTVFSGFVAQEVEQAAKDARYDFSGVDKPKNEKDMYGLRYADFVVPLVKAVQEQQQMIRELQKQNAELQKRVIALEKKDN